MRSSTVPTKSGLLSHEGASFKSNDSDSEGIDDDGDSMQIRSESHANKKAASCCRFGIARRGRGSLVPDRHHSQ